MVATPRPSVAIRVVRADGGPEALVPMLGDSLTCGRAGDVALSDDPFVAEHQVRFYLSGGRVAVEDIGGGNGVYLRLRQEREVPVGGELRVGRQRLVLESLPPATAGADNTMAWGSPDDGFRFRLVQMFEGGIRAAAFALHDGDNLLAREVGDICFPMDGFVSGRHAVVHVAGDRIAVRDVGSSNGSFVRLTGPTFVEHLDQFLVGRQLVRVEISGSAGAS